MARPATFSAAALAMGLLALGCASTGEVIVDVRTDFSPGRDFDAVVVTTPGARTVAPAAITDWLAGVRIGPTPSPEGSQAVAVELQYGGATLVRRTVRVVVTGTVVVPVWLVRACAEVSCPEPGRPLATECADGRCVAPECVTTGDDCPTPICARDADCTPSDIACAAHVCREGHCVFETIAGVCPAGRWCDPTRGCSVDTFDGGMPDAGRLDAPGLDAGHDTGGGGGCTEPCNDGNPCTYGDRCSGGGCTGTAIDCSGMDDDCHSYACNGTSSCGVTIHNGAPCASDGNPCTDDHCGPGGSCRHDPVGDDTDCGGGRFCCNGNCTSDSTSDCGGCNARCGAGESCSGGRCTCGGNSGGVGGGAVCGGTDPRCCGGSCVDLWNDYLNCGSCGARCGDQYGDCDGGNCTCGSDARCPGGGSICCRCGPGCAGSYCAAPGTCGAGCC